MLHDFRHYLLRLWKGESNSKPENIRNDTWHSLGFGSGSGSRLGGVAGIMRVALRVVKKKVHAMDQHCKNWMVESRERGLER